MLALVALVVPARGQNIDVVAADAGAKAQVLARVSDLLTKYAYVPGLDFSRWSKFIADEQQKIDAAKNDEEFVRAVNQAAAKFGASHIVLGTPRAAAIRTTQHTVGIGITSQIVPDGVLIVRLVDKAPAANAGLVPGDTIVEVDGKKAEGIKGIPGEKGTSLKLKVKHADGKFGEYTLVREPFSTVRKEELIEVDKDTARLAIYTFDFSYDRARVEELMTKAQSYPNLIVDLRDNPGGAVINLEHLMGLFVPKDKVVGVFVDRRLVNAWAEENKDQKPDVSAIAKWSLDAPEAESSLIHPFSNRHVSVYKGHVAVLVNNFSGSASEICAAGLRDTLGASVLGTKSAGAVLVSVIVPTSNQFTLQYPIMDYVTVKGLRLEGKGVVPDFVVEEPKLRLPNLPDKVQEKAALLLEKGPKAPGLIAAQTEAPKKG